MHSRIVPPTFTKQLSCIRGQNRPESQSLGWVCAGGWRGLWKADQLGPGWLLELQPAEAQSPVALLGPWPGLGGCGLVALGTYLSLRLWWVVKIRRFTAMRNHLFFQIKVLFSCVSVLLYSKQRKLATQRTENIRPFQILSPEFKGRIFLKQFGWNVTCCTG